MSKLNLIISDEAFEHIQYWLQNDKKIAIKIFKLIESCKTTPFEGIGKPEPLKHILNGSWSRRIDQEHRLVYKVEDNNLIIIQCRFHY
jgi:toxin YoeB